MVADAYAPLWLRVVPWVALALAVLCVAAEVGQWLIDRRNRRRGM